MCVVIEITCSVFKMYKKQHWRKINGFDVDDL